MNTSLAEREVLFDKRSIQSGPPGSSPSLLQQTTTPSRLVDPRIKKRAGGKTRHRSRATKFIKIAATGKNYES